MNTLSKTEQIVLRLIKQDLLYLFTVHRNISTIGASYLVALFSYIGLIIDGCEDWTNKVNALKNDALKFSTEESQYYSDLRNSIKLWEMQFTDLYRMINMKYCESENHFANCCKPIAKNLQLYDIFGTYIINGKYCDNTILDMLFAPGYKLGNENGDYIRKMAEFAGKTMASFAVNKNNTYEINHTFTFTTKDFGGFEKSPLGDSFNPKFVLFSILCSINFIVFGVEKLIVPEVPTKLRFAYIQYYYLLQQLPQINTQFNTKFRMDNQWIDPHGDFRNCMAHYGLGSVLSQNEVVETDMFGGLTQKLFGCDWLIIKNSIIKELMQLSTQIEIYLCL